MKPRNEACMSPLGRRVYRLRQGRGMGLTELAKRAGLPKPMISMLELGYRRDQHVGIKVLCGLARGLGCSLDVLVGRAEDGQL